MHGKGPSGPSIGMGDEIVMGSLEVYCSNEVDGSAAMGRKSVLAEIALWVSSWSVV